MTLEAGFIIDRIEPKGKKLEAYLKSPAGQKVTKPLCAWADSPESANWSVGTVLGKIETETQEYNGNKQIWVKKHPGGAKGSRGGVAKADPEKTRAITDCNKNNNDTMSFANKVNAATSCIKCATELYVTMVNAGTADEETKGDPVNTIKGFAESFYDSIHDMANGRTIREAFQ